MSKIFNAMAVFFQSLIPVDMAMAMVHNVTKKGQEIYTQQ